MEASTLPDEISQVTDDILSTAIKCEISGRPFVIVKQELAFYRKHRLPLPRRHPNVRHEERVKQRPGRTLFLRMCDKCRKEILSVYPMEDVRRVYCEECYGKEVYG